MFPRHVIWIQRVPDQTNKAKEEHRNSTERWGSTVQLRGSRHAGPGAHLQGDLVDEDCLGDAGVAKQLQVAPDAGRPHRTPHQSGQLRGAGRALICVLHGLMDGAGVHPVVERPRCDTSPVHQAAPWQHSAGACGGAAAVRKTCFKAKTPCLSKLERVFNGFLTWRSRASRKSRRSAASRATW